MKQRIGQTYDDIEKGDKTNKNRKQTEIQLTETLYVLKNGKISSNKYE